MSRIGKYPVPIPEGVTVTIEDRTLNAQGKRGALGLVLMDEVAIEMKDGQITVRPVNDSGRARQMWGTARARVANLVKGVAIGFKKELEIHGVGYRAAMRGGELVLQLGFSHEVRHPVPDGVTISCPDQTHVVIEGADKQLVGQTAAVIRDYRPPEPYKGKGVRYVGEYIPRKEGKKK